MAATTLTNVQVLYNTTDISAFTGEFNPETTVVLQPVNNLAGGGYQHSLPGVTSATLSLSGLADYAAAGLNSVFAGAQRGRQEVVSIVKPVSGAAVAGDAAILMRGQLAKYVSPQGATGATAAFASQIEADAAQVYGVVGAPLLNRSAPLTGTSLQLGALGTGPAGATQRLWAALHVTAAAGTNLSVLIQSDNATGFPSPATALTFTTVSAVSAQFLNLVGPLTDDWYRVTATIGTGNFTFAVTLGVW